MPVHETEGGYKYGKTGKTYKKKKDAIKQAVAIAYSQARKKGRKPTQEEIKAHISGNPDELSKTASAIAKIAADYKPSMEELLSHAHKSGGKHTALSILGERKGPTLSLIASILAGSAIGGLAGYAGGENTLGTALAGGATGGAIGLLGNLGGAAAAGLTPTRTAAEQKAHDDALNLAQWLIPGIGVYNRYKRLGRQAAEIDEPQQA